MYRVAVIGAGASGLSAARYVSKVLSKSNDIIVLEAQQRCGGRILTDRSMNGSVVELGADLIHGRSSSLHRLLLNFGLKSTFIERTITPMWSLAPCDPNQKQLALIQRYERVWRVLRHLPNRLPNDDCSLRKHLIDLGFDQHDLSIVALIAPLAYGCQLDDLSLFEFAREIETDQSGPRDFALINGMDQLIDHLSTHLNIQFGFQVKSIQHSNNKHVLITSSDGHQITANQCIIAIPIPVLQSNSIDFIPKLDRQTQQAIDSFIPIDATKFAFIFNQPVCKTDSILISHHHFKPLKWNAIGPVITCTLVGKQSLEFDQLTEQDCFTQISNLLFQLIQRSPSDLIAFKRMNWSNEPFARAAFTLIPPNHSESIKVLASTTMNCLSFATDSISSFGHSQTIESAIQSGKRAAIECLKKLSNH